MKIILISGFLGSGKTTFLHHLSQEISAQKSHKIALIINEFADISFDAPPFMERYTTMAITHGSIMCTCKTDEFLGAIQKLAADGFDYALVEASGFANLKGLQAVVDALSPHLDVVWYDRIVLVDAAKILKWLKVAVNAQNQIEMATIVIINKIDLVNQTQMEEVQHKIAVLNPQAKIYCTSYGKVNLAPSLLPASLHTEQPIWLTKNLCEAFLTIPIEQDISLAQWEAALTALSDKIFRAKGFVRADEKVYYIDFSSTFVATPAPYAKEVGKLVVLYDTALVNRKEILAVFQKISNDKQ